MDQPWDVEAELEQRVIIRNAPWAYYEATCALRGEGSVPRIAYLDKVMELMTPGYTHERIGSQIGALLLAYAVERDITLTSVGSWTIKIQRKKAGVEPDECFILGPPPRTPRRPDLAIEVIQTSGGIDKLEIYHRLGVREVWFWKDAALEVYVRGSRGFTRRTKSACLPDLDLRLLCSFLELPTTEAIKAYRAALSARG